MKYILTIIAALFILTSVSYAAPFSWDYTGGVVRLLSPQNTAQVQVPSVTATSSATNTLPVLAVPTRFSFGGVIGTAWSDFCTAITGGSGLCDGNDATGGGGGGSISTSSSPTAGQLTVWTSPSTVAGVATGTLTETVSGLQLDATRALVGGSAVLSLTSGYEVPLTASTTQWQTAFGWGNHTSAGYLTAVPTTTVRGMFSATSPATYNSGTGAIGVNVTGDWTGTFDGIEGSAYLSRANHTGTQLSSTISDLTSTVRGLISETVTGLDYNSSTGVLSTTAGYTIPLTASTSQWASTSASNTLDVTLAGTPNYLTIAGQTITRALINLQSHVTSFLGLTNGGTGTSTAPTTDQILVGNSGGSYDYRRIVAGSNVTVSTSTAGELQISSIGGGGSSNWTDNGTFLTPLTSTDGIFLTGSSTLQNLSNTSATTTLLAIGNSSPVELTSPGSSVLSLQGRGGNLEQLSFDLGTTANTVALTTNSGVTALSATGFRFDANQFRSAMTVSSSSPAFSFTGDANTGMFKNGSGDINSIGFSTNGVPRTFITQAGQLVVATTSSTTAAEAGRLTVVENGEGDYTAALVSTNSGSFGSSLLLQQRSASPASFDEVGGIYFVGNSADGVEREVASIKGGWNNPTTRTSELEFRVGDSNIFYAQASSTDPSSNYMTIGAGGSIEFYADYLGFFSPLQVASSLLDTTGAAGLLGQVLQSTGTSTRWVATSSLGLGGVGGSGTVNSGTTGQIGYYASNGTAVSGTSSLFIAADGKVGIGTTSPTANLSVQATAGVDMFDVASSTGQSVFEILASGAMRLLGISEPSAPSSGYLLTYVRDIASRLQLFVKGPTGEAMPVQEALWNSSLVMWRYSNATAGVWTGSAAGSGNGTYSSPVLTTTSRYTMMRRGVYSNVVTTANQVIGQRNTESIWYRGDATTRGGFYACSAFGADTWTNGSRLFFGLHTGTTVVSADPSALNNTVGFAVDAADNGAISFLTRGTSATKAPTGFTISSGKGYRACFHAAPNSTQIGWWIRDINTGSEASGIATTTLPATNTVMALGTLGSNAALTPVNSLQLGVAQMTIQSDY